MGATKNQLEEFHYLEVTDSYFKQNYNTFRHNDVKVIRTIVKDDLFKDDTYHKTLLKIYRSAQKNLRDYEYNKRHNHIKKIKL